MNRSSKGFGLAGVLATVVLLIVAAVFSASAKSETHAVHLSEQQIQNISWFTTLRDPL
jgi:hypothetical protein